MSDSTSIPDGYKRCSKGADCVNPDGPILPATTKYFYMRETGRFRQDCIECVKARIAENYQKNRARYDAYHTQWRDANRDYLRERTRKWRNNNLELARESNRRYQAKNIEQIRIKNRRYQRENLDKAYVSWQRRRARKHSLPDCFTLADWQRALEYFNGCCAVCGRQLNDLFGEHTAAMDHWIPLSSPDCPGTVPTNIVPLCHGVGGCNNSKSNSEPVKWLEWKHGKRKARQIERRINEYFKSL